MIYSRRLILVVHRPRVYSVDRWVCCAVVSCARRRHDEDHFASNVSLSHSVSSLCYSYSAGICGHVVLTVHVDAVSVIGATFTINHKCHVLPIVIWWRRTRGGWAPTSTSNRMIAQRIRHRHRHRLRFEEEEIQYNVIGFDELECLFR